MATTSERDSVAAPCVKPLYHIGDEGTHLEKRFTMRGTGTVSQPSVGEHLGRSVWTVSMLVPGDVSRQDLCL